MNVKNNVTNKWTLSDYSFNKIIGDEEDRQNE